MKSTIQRIPYPKRPDGSLDRDKWLKLRNEGVGGSDIGSIMGVDKYKPALKLFHQKIGLWNTDEQDNIAAYAGRVWEDGIYEHFWKYWYPGATKKQVLSGNFDGNRELMLQNANSGEVVRKAHRVNSLIINPDYPWIRVNLDREILKYSDMDNGVLELKKPKSMHWNTYEAGVPPGYIFQVQSQLIATGYVWGELFAVLDGVDPQMFRFEKSVSLQEAILEKTKAFWDNVLIGREIMADKSLTREQKIANLAPYEPDAESSDAYEDYLKDRFKSDANDNQVLSTDQIEDLRAEYWLHHGNENESKKLKTGVSNEIRNFLRQNNSDTILLNDESMITLRVDAKGTVRLNIPKIKDND